MKLFMIFIMTLFISSFASADYDFENVYRFDNIDMIKNNDDSNVANMTVNGFSSDSNGNKATSKCLISLRNGIVKGNCQGTDQDGDIEYTTVERDITKGNVGQIMRTGGTGKYADKTSSCEYNVILTDFKVGVGYLTGSCKE
jgi:hypothetical protein